MMKIDVHNYEEFLLLYIDGELNASEMQQVENFAKAYPHVQAELNALQATKLMPEEISFGHKESLFKTQTAQEITTENFKEKMLLYVDDELTATQKMEVEKFVLHHPNLQNEFTVLKQTKLPQEIIACPNKEDLYKKKDKRAVIFYLSRMVVAAVFVGLIGFAYLLITKKENGIEGSSTAKTTLPTKVNTGTVVTPKVEDSPSNSTLPQKQTITTSSIAAGINNSKQNQKSSTLGVEPKNIVPTPNVPSNNVVLQKNNPVITPKKEEEDVVVNPSTTNPFNNIIVTTPGASIAKNNVAEVVKSTEEANTKTAFTPTVYKQLDIENEESNTILVGNMRMNKAKVKNLFNKVGKLFGKSKKAQMEEEENAKKAVASTK